MRVRYRRPAGTHSATGACDHAWTKWQTHTPMMAAPYKTRHCRACGIEQHRRDRGRS